MKKSIGTLGDAWLVRRASAGDESAFEELAARHRPILTTLARRILRNREDASDMVQETLLKAFRALPEFDPERPVRPWLCRICSNCCVDAVRSRKRDPSALDSQSKELPDLSQSVDDRVTDLILRGQLVEALNRLPAQYGKILFMRHFQFKDVTEIAFELKKPEGTIKSWLFRARALLKKELSISLP